MNPDKVGEGQFMSWVVSQAIRNELEMFHGGGAYDPENPDSDEGFITDKQMKALNIVIRRTVHKALNIADDDDFASCCMFQILTAHDYMEAPGSPNHSLSLSSPSRS